MPLSSQESPKARVHLAGQRSAFEPLFARNFLVHIEFSRFVSKQNLRDRTIINNTYSALYVFNYCN